MTNHFGGLRGNRGPPGQKGADGFSLHQWFPAATLKMFRESESCNFYFNSETDGIVKKDEKGIGLLNRTGGNNALLIRGNFPRFIRLKTSRYAVELKASLFEIKDMDAALVHPSIAVFALTFKPLQKPSKAITSMKTSTLFQIY